MSTSVTEKRRVQKHYLKCFWGLIFTHFTVRNFKQLGVAFPKHEKMMASQHRSSFQGGNTRSLYTVSSIESRDEAKQLEAEFRLPQRVNQALLFPGGCKQPLGQVEVPASPACGISR